MIANSRDAADRYFSATPVWKLAAYLSALLLACLAATALADENIENYWCGEFSYDQNNPLAWSKLQQDIDRRLAAHQFTDAYQVSIDALETQISLVGLSWHSKDLSVLRQAIDKYLAQISSSDGRETPTAWDLLDGPAIGEQIQYDFSGIEGIDSNHFIALNCADINSQNHSPEATYQLCHCATGIGAGGILLACRQELG